MARLPAGSSFFGKEHYVKLLVASAVAAALVLTACQAPPSITSSDPAPDRVLDGVANVASFFNTPIPGSDPARREAEPVTNLVSGPMFSGEKFKFPPNFTYRALGGANGFGSTYVSGNTTGGL
jgi:hypothetical protein